MTVEQNKAAVREFTRVFKNQHHVDGIDHLFAREFRHNFKGPIQPGLAGFKDVGRMMNGAFPDVAVTETDLIGTEDTVVERSRLDKAGKICEHWVELAMLELALQTGAARMTGS
jgi:predicted ester cyclase